VKVLLQVLVLLKSRVVAGEVGFCARRGLVGVANVHGKVLRRQVPSHGLIDHLEVLPEGLVVGDHIVVVVEGYEQVHISLIVVDGPQRREVLAQVLSAYTIVFEEDEPLHQQGQVHPEDQVDQQACYASAGGSVGGAALVEVQLNGVPEDVE